MWRSFVDVAQGLGEPRTLVSIIVSWLCSILLCVWSIFISMILMHVLLLDNNGKIGDDNGDMVNYEIC